MANKSSRPWVAAMVAALVAGLLSLGGAAPAQAAVSWECTGKAVKRCTAIYWDRSTDRFQGRARIVDADGGTNYRVRVKDITVVRFNGSGYVKVRSAGDYDGWSGRVDRGRTRYFNPCRWPTNTFEVRATFSWRTPAGVTTRRWGPPSAWGGPC